MPLDGRQIVAAAEAIGMADYDGATLGIHRALCLQAPEELRRLAGDTAPLIACTQEAAALAAAWAASGDAGEPQFVDIRDSAGWSSEAGAATPKIAALLAAAQVEQPAADAVRAGPPHHVVILGRSAEAIDAAARLPDGVDATVVLTPDAEIPPPPRNIARMLFGWLRTAVGAFGRFHLDFGSLAKAAPWSREQVRSLEASLAVLTADLVLDLRGGPSPFPAPRLGWLRADPARPGEIAAALLELRDLAGEIAVPRAVAQRRDRCVHAAGGRTICTRCLDVCPTGALSPAGAAVALDPLICAGCGACAAVCPTGALAYAAPPLEVSLRRIAVLLGAYRVAGGRRPILLLHGGGETVDALTALARSGPGLPANVLPLLVDRPTQFGVEALVSMFALGAVRVVLWDAGPDIEAEAAGLRTAATMTQTMLSILGLGGDRVCIVTSVHPHGVQAAVRDDPALVELPPADGLDLEAPEGARLHAGLAHLLDAVCTIADPLALPQGAPCGNLEVAESCTLCLACTRACPTGALDGDARTQVLTFRENACVQCDACRAICPEQAITLVPRVSGSSAAVRKVLVQDEAALCVRCGRPFGGRRAIEGVIARLRRITPELPTRELDRLRACDACRVEV